MSEQPVLLFDGVCNLCSSSVQFVIKHDPKGKLKFAALQSEVGKQLLAKHQLSTKALSSLVLVEGDRVFTHSTGALRLSKYLSGLWPMAYGLVVIPAFLRNMVYNWIAKNRYKWFGEKTECWIPTPELKSRFLG